MRTVYLIRHGTPAFPDGKRICLSRTDLPLCDLGHAQGAALRTYFSKLALSGVYCSTLTRARETAAYLSPQAVAVEGFEELGVGCWEGLTFREIRERYPELYALRGEDPVNHVMSGGEFPLDCQKRSVNALQTLLAQTTGDIAIVAHAGVNRLILCSILHQDAKQFLSIPQPYGCINILHVSHGELTADRIGFLPENT